MSENPAELNSAGLHALGQGQAAQAVALLRRAVALDAASPLLWYNLANAHHGTGDLAAHDQALDEALTLDPYFAHALLAKGHLREDKGDTAAALEFYRRLLAVFDPAAPMGPGFTAGVAHARQVVAASTAALEIRLEQVLATSLTHSPRLPPNASATPSKLA
jgi:tetratricopeptide (TPR) repeat protein